MILRIWEKGGNRYESNFIFALLLQIAIKRFSRHSKFRLPFEFTMALESLALQIPKTARPLILQMNPPTLFQRIAANDRTAAAGCVDAYGNFIWALARNLTATPEEAEEAAKEIFIDIWHYSERADQIKSDENLLVALIARRRLIKHLQTAKQESMSMT